MSEKQPKLKFEEEKERTATRSPPKKSKVEQSKPKKQKLKLDAEPCVRRGAGGVAGRVFLLHGGEHFHRIQMLVIDKIPLPDADGKRHTGQPYPSVRTGEREQITA